MEMLTLDSSEHLIEIRRWHDFFIVAAAAAFDVNTIGEYFIPDCCNNVRRPLLL